MQNYRADDTIVVMPAIGNAQAILFVYIAVLILIVIGVSVYAQILLSRLHRIQKERTQLSGHLDNVRKELAYANHTLADSSRTASLDQTLDTLPVISMIVSRDGTVTYISPYAESALNIKKMDAVLKPFPATFGIRSPDDPDLSSRIINACDGTVRLPAWSVLSAGERHVTINGVAVPLPDGTEEAKSAAFVAVETGEERKTYEAVAEKLTTAAGQLDDAHTAMFRNSQHTELSKSVIQAMEIGMIGLDDAGTITTVNQAAEKILGVLAQELTGTPLRHALRITNGKDEEDLRILDAARSGKAEPIPKWTFFPKRGGEHRAVAGSVIPFRSDTDKRTRAVVAFSDAQDQYLAEQEEKAFFSGAAHDLRAPLTTIRGVVELLNEQYGSVDQAQAKEMLSGAREAVTHLIDLVNDLLNVSRIEMGRIKINKEAFSILTVTKEVIDGMTVLAREKHLYLTHEYTDVQIPDVYGDKVKTQEILTNLISNAIKYTQQGGITVSHRLENGKITTSVTDTGMGISPEQSGLLFKKFQQVGSARKLNTSKSTGLGLYISKTFAEMMGGELKLVRSEQGQGSEFSFSLPTV